MDRAAEQKALAEVQARLELRFPDAHPDVVAAAVRLAHSKLDGPVRDFVPLLVEHAARDHLAFAEPDLPQDTPPLATPRDGLSVPAAPVSGPPAAGPQVPDVGAEALAVDP